MTDDQLKVVVRNDLFIFSYIFIMVHTTLMRIYVAILLINPVEVN